MLEAHALQPAAIIGFPRQASQYRQLGVLADIGHEEAEILCDQHDAWLVQWRGVPIACIGIQETFEGRQGVAWALLGNLPAAAAHLALTRFARERVAASPLRRVEAIVQGPDAEAILELYPALDAHSLLAACKAVPTPEMIWASLIGLSPVHVLRRFGAAGDTHVLCERIS